MQTETAIQLIQALRQPFTPEAHKERKLPGGGKWFYLPWQTIRDRLDELFPFAWECSYSDPVIAGDYTVIRCRLTLHIDGQSVTREGVGNDKAYPELNDQGKAKTIGTPPERARADAFKNAAEEFGVGSYIDDQKFVIRYLQGKGDGRGAKFATENGWMSQQPQGDSGPIGREKLLAMVGAEVKRIGWNNEQGADFLESKYGKRSRKDLTNNQLSEAIGLLRGMVSAA